MMDEKEKCLRFLRGFVSQLVIMWVIEKIYFLKLGHVFLLLKVVFRHYSRLGHCQTRSITKVMRTINHIPIKLLSFSRLWAISEKLVTNWIVQNNNNTIVYRLLTTYLKGFIQLSLMINHIRRKQLISLTKIHNKQGRYCTHCR